MRVWLVVDPKSHWYQSQSPYVFTLNNPIMLHDPNGQWVEGGGFFKNLFYSDSKVVEKMAQKHATEIGGTLMKVDGGYRVMDSVSYSNKEISTEENNDLGEVGFKDFYTKNLKSKGEGIVAFGKVIWPKASNDRFDQIRSPYDRMTFSGSISKTENRSIQAIEFGISSSSESEVLPFLQNSISASTNNSSEVSAEMSLTFKLKKGQSPVNSLTNLDLTFQHKGISFNPETRDLKISIGITIGNSKKSSKGDISRELK
jgi:hypothetical protein